MSRKIRVNSDPSQSPPLDDEDIIQTQWLKFRDMVLPDDLTPNQLENARMCFFGGAVVGHVETVSAFPRPDTINKIVKSLNKYIEENGEWQ